MIGNPSDDEGGDAACWAHLFEGVQGADLGAVAASTAVRGPAWRLTDAELNANLLVFDTGQGILAQEQETHRAQQYVNNNLQLMATRLGELQAQLLHLDTLGERLSALAGVKREARPVRGSHAGQGGAFVPAPLGADELQREIDRLAREVDVRTDELAVLE